MTCAQSDYLLKVKYGFLLILIMPLYDYQLELMVLFFTTASIVKGGGVVVLKLKLELHDRTQSHLCYLKIRDCIFSATIIPVWSVEARIITSLRASSSRHSAFGFSFWRQYTLRQGPCCYSNLEEERWRWLQRRRSRAY